MEAAEAAEAGLGEGSVRCSGPGPVRPVGQDGVSGGETLGLRTGDSDPGRESSGPLRTRREQSQGGGVGPGGHTGTSCVSRRPAT